MVLVWQSCFFHSSDPCYNVFCTKGRMCVVNTDRSTTCVCPKVCPDDYNPVCSVYLREFNNTCKLYKFACRIGIMMGIEKTGKCDLKGVYLANNIRAYFIQWNPGLLPGYPWEFLMAQKPSVPLGRHIPIWLIYGSIPPSGSADTRL